MKVVFKNLINSLMSQFKPEDDVMKGANNPMFMLDVMRHLNIDRNIQISESVMDSNKLLGLVLDELVKGDMLDALILDESLVKGWKTKAEIDDSFALVKSLVKDEGADPSVLIKAQDNISDLNEVQRLIKGEDGNVTLQSFFVNDLNKAFGDQRVGEETLKKGDEVLLYWIGNYTGTSFISKGVVDHVGEDWIDAKLTEDLKPEGEFIYKAEHTIHVPRIHNAAWSEDWRIKPSK